MKIFVDFEFILVAEAVNIVYGNIMNGNIVTTVIL